jgi:hypothetical protein
MTVFVFDYRRTRINSRPINDQLPHLVKIRGRHRFGKGQLPGEDRRDTDFVRLDVHIWRDDRTSGIINTFTLK